MKHAAPASHDQFRNFARSVLYLPYVIPAPVSPRPPCYGARVPLMTPINAVSAHSSPQPQFGRLYYGLPSALDGELAEKADVTLRRGIQTFIEQNRGLGGNQEIDVFARATDVAGEPTLGVGLRIGVNDGQRVYLPEQFGDDNLEARHALASDPGAESYLTETDYLNRFIEKAFERHTGRKLGAGFLNRLTWGLVG